MNYLSIIFSEIYVFVFPFSNILKIQVEIHNSCVYPVSTSERIFFVSLNSVLA